MHILMIEHSGRGGMYAYTDALCRGLCEAGGNVTVLTSSAWPEKSVPFNVKRRLSEFTREQGKGSRLHWAADRFYRSVLNSLRRNRFALKEQFDVVHFQGAGMPLLDQFFLKPLAKRLPVIMTVHDIKSHYERFVSRDSFLRRSLRIPHGLITHYQDGKKQLIYHWGIEDERVDVIPHGIMAPLHRPVDRSEARRKLNLPEDRRILMFFGSIRPNKGLDILLEALNDIRLHDPKVLLIVAGAVPRGMNFQKYSDIIQKLNLSENVRTKINFILDEDVDNFMAAVDVIVLPYTKFEAQSGVLLRAYAHKKPVVVSDVGAMSELVSSDKVGLVVEPGSPKLLAEAIINVLDNSGDFQSHYTKQLEEKYSWRNIAEMTIRSYEKAINLWR